jgi:hypothetical protein
MNTEDLDNPFVECELCETMVRFNDYHQHISECMDMVGSGVPRLLPMNMERVNAIRQRRRADNSNEDNVDDREDYNDGEDDEDNEDDYGDITHEERRRRVDLDTAHENIEYDDEDEDEDELESNEDESVDYNRAENENIPRISFQFAVYQGNLGTNNQTQQTNGHTNEQVQPDSTVQNDSLQRFERMLENIRNGTVRPADIGSLLSDDESLHTPTLPILSNTNIDPIRDILNELEPLIPSVNGSTSAQPPSTPPRLESPFLTAFPFTALSTLLPLPPLMPLEADDTYEYNLLLAERLGRVEKGIRNIDEVCKVIDKDSLDTGEYDEEICAVCQDTVGTLRKEEKKIIRKTLCNHVYCDTCIRTWLNKNVRCPVCQVDLDEMVSQKNK